MSAHVSEGGSLLRLQEWMGNNGSLRQAILPSHIYCPSFVHTRGTRAVMFVQTS